MVSPIAPLHFLLIDDDDAHARIILSAFGAGEPCTIHRVATGRDGMDYLNRASPRADVVLLDLRLPGLDGFDILHMIRSDPGLKTTPVVVLTTSNSDQDHRLASEKGADSYIVKPAVFGDLCAVITELKRYWLRRRSQPAPS